MNWLARRQTGHWETLDGIKTWVRRCACGAMQFWHGAESRHDAGSWVTRDAGKRLHRHGWS